MTSEELWRYYGIAAKALGASKGEDDNGNEIWVRQFYSLASFFREDDNWTFKDPIRGCLPANLDSRSLLLKAFLNCGGAMDEFKERCKYGKEHMPTAEQIGPYLCPNPNKKPYADQIEAIRHAVSMPLTLIQGPPGTGKTETILNLLSVIHGLETEKVNDPQNYPNYKHATVAVVSGANEAIRNINDAIFNGNDFKDLRTAYSNLGNKDNREKWKNDFYNAGAADEHTDINRGHFNILDFYEEEPDIITNDANPPRNVFKKEYLARRPIFSSTIHSLRNCFFGSDGRLVEKFDYIIADECSQVDLLVGLVALGCAEKLIVLGDNNQLGPIVNEGVLNKLCRSNDILQPDRDELKISNSNSFLKVCEAVFGDTVPSFLLREHYRCVPEIIGFCNEHIYDNRLIVKTHSIKGNIPFHIYWYEGDYSQYVSAKEPGRAPDAQSEDMNLPPVTEQTPQKKVLVNERQMAIFFEEVLPDLLLTPSVCDPETGQYVCPSICVISPYRRPINELGRLLKDHLMLLNRNSFDHECWKNIKEKAGNDPDKLKQVKNRVGIMLGSLNTENTDNAPDNSGSENNNEDNGIETDYDIGSLTVHKSQGKGFDIVCFLTIRDYYQKNSKFGVWAQQKQMINVAVSRAKKQFYLITSSRWMPLELLDRENAWTWEGEELTDSRLYVHRLLGYIYGITKDTDIMPGSFHRSKITSIFDSVPRYRYINRLNGVREPSAPELCMYDLLSSERFSGYSVIREFPLKKLIDWKVINISTQPNSVKRFIQFASVDFLLYKDSKIVCGIEVDGNYHRADAKQAYHDRWKNEIFDAADIGLARLKDDGSIYPAQNDVMKQYIRCIVGKTSEETVSALEKFVSDNCAKSCYTIPHEESAAIGMMTESRIKRIELLGKLTAFLSNALEDFKGLGYETCKEIAENLAYKDKKSISGIKYDKAHLDQLYFMRYGMAYALEYAMMYDIILRDFIRSGGSSETLRVSSFGCGGFLDAWALAYTMARLRSKCVAVPDAEYDGIDLKEWEYRLDGQHYGLDGLKVNELYEMSLEKYVPADGSERTVLFFPRILNELTQQAIDEFIDNLGNYKFGKTVYVCAMHGSENDLKGDSKRDTEIVKRIVEKIVKKIGDSSCQIIDDLADMLGDDFEAVRSGYPGNASFNFAVNNKDLKLEKYYTFKKISSKELEELYSDDKEIRLEPDNISPDADAGSEDLRLRHSEIDPDFQHDDVAGYLNDLNDKVNGEGDSDIRIEQMQYTYTSFQIFKIIK